MSNQKTEMRFSGPEYDEKLDKARLSHQHEKIRDLMMDGEWRTLSEIARVTGAPEASISAQLRHFRKKRFGSHTVEKRRRGEPKAGLWEYRVLPPGYSVQSRRAQMPSKDGIERALAELRDMMRFALDAGHQVQDGEPLKNLLVWLSQKTKRNRSNDNTR